MDKIFKLNKQFLLIAALLLFVIKILITFSYLKNAAMIAILILAIYFVCVGFYSLILLYKSKLMKEKIDYYIMYLVYSIFIIFSGFTIFYFFLSNYGRLISSSLP